MVVFIAALQAARRELGGFFHDWDGVTVWPYFCHSTFPYASRSFGIVLQPKRPTTSIRGASRAQPHRYASIPQLP